MRKGEEIDSGLLGVGYEDEEDERGEPVASVACPRFGGCPVCFLVVYLVRCTLGLTFELLRTGPRRKATEETKQSRPSATTISGDCTVSCFADCKVKSRSIDI